MQLDDQISEHQTISRWTSQIVALTCIRNRISPGEKYSLGEGKIGVELHAKFPLHSLENPVSTAHQLVEEFYTYLYSMNPVVHADICYPFKSLYSGVVYIQIKAHTLVC